MVKAKFLYFVFNKYGYTDLSEVIQLPYSQEIELLVAVFAVSLFLTIQQCCNECFFPSVLF